MGGRDDDGHRGDLPAPNGAAGSGAAFAVIGALLLPVVVIGVFVLVAALSPLLAPHDPALRLLVTYYERFGRLTPEDRRRMEAAGACCV